MRRSDRRGSRAPRARPTDLDARAALVAFAAVVAAALFLYMFVARREWFHADEWDFIVARNGGNLGDLFRPHNEHWSTLPIVEFRLLWRVVGVRSYTPYLLVVIALHLTVACLLRAVMRRAGVGAWTATAAAALFVFFGTGYDNIVYAFQVGFVGALALGLTQLLLADHEGPLSRNDWIGLAAGLAALLCSGVAVTMVAIVGLATLVRRGWRVALFHVVPCAIVYLVWLVSCARNSYASPARPSQVARFVATDLRATFGAFGQLPGVGAFLGIVLVAGLALASRSIPEAERRARLAAPGALLVGAVLFLVVTGIGRSGPSASPFFRQPPTASRYLHIVAALVVPALAIAIDAVARRCGRAGAVAAVLLLVVGIPGNVDALRKSVDQSVPSIRIYRAAILGASRLPMLHDLPRSYQPLLPYAPDVNVGWIIDSAAAGRLPSSRPLTAQERSQLALALVLHGSPASARGRCERIDATVTRVVTAGDSVDVGTGRAELAYVHAGVPLLAVAYGSHAHRVTLAVATGPVSLRITPVARTRVELCRGAGAPP